MRRCHVVVRVLPLVLAVTPHVLVEESHEDLLRWLDRIWRQQVPTEPDPEIDTALRECLRLATGGQ